MSNQHKVGISAENSDQVGDELAAEEVEGDSLTVTGMALPFEEVSRNGVQYSRSSVEENADTLEGQPVLFNHDEDEVAGHVKSVEVKDDGLFYEMDLDPEHELARKVERGDISSVSIQAFVERREGDTPVVDVTEFLELSLVSIPGFEQTSTNVEAVPADAMAMETFKEEYMSEDGKGAKYSEIVEGTVDEAKERLEEMSDVNYEAVYVEEMHGKDRKTLKSYLEEQMSEQDDEWRVQMPAYDSARETQWDGVDKSEFQSGDEFRSVHMLVKDADEALPVAHRESDELVLVYEALNSAYDTAERVSGVSDETVARVRERLNELKGKEFPDREPLDADQSEETFSVECGDCGSEIRVEAETLKNVEYNNINMSDKEQFAEAFSDLDERDMFDFIASHYEDVTVDDVAELYEDAEFTGFDEREVAALVADALDVEAGEVLDMFEEVMDAEDDGEDDGDEPEDEPEEGGDYDGEDDEDESEESSDEREDMTREDLIERIEALEEKVNSEESEAESEEDDSEEEGADDEDEDSESETVEDEPESSRQVKSENKSKRFVGSFPRIGG